MEPKGIRSEPYPIDPSEILSIQQTWDITKRMPNIAPKIFIK